MARRLLPVRVVRRDRTTFVAIERHAGMTSLCYLLAAAALTACATDDATDDTSSTEQAVTGTVLASHYCPAHHLSSPCPFDLGPTSGRACVLAGLAGDASAYPDHTGDDGSITQISVSGGHYWLTIATPAESGITANTVCVAPANNPQGALWQSNVGGAAVQITGTDASTRCFLSEVEAFGGMVSYNDSVHTWRDSSGTWWLGGQTSGNFVGGGATCFDATEIGTFGWGQYGGTNSGVITSNGTGGTACGLAEIGGVFESTAQNDGVLIDFQNNNWVWTFVGAKHAYADCIR
jgi:hypothetical protein